MHALLVPERHALTSIFSTVLFKNLRALTSTMPLPFDAQMNLMPVSMPKHLTPVGAVLIATAHLFCLASPEKAEGKKKRAAWSISILPRK